MHRRVTCAVNLALTDLWDRQNDHVDSDGDDSYGTTGSG